jgi:hypothetical protein
MQAQFQGSIRPLRKITGQLALIEGENLFVRDVESSLSIR